MFFYDGIREGGQMIKSVCACLCCCICAGPILVIVGVVIIFSPNTRKEDVKAYNVAVADWKSGTAEADVNGWLPGTIGGSKAEIAPMPVVVSGDTDDVSYPSIEVPSVTAKTKFENDVSASYYLNNVDPFSVNVTTSISKTVDLYCKDKRGCSSREMESECRSRYPSGKYSGNGCRNKGPCGSCKYAVYVKDICAVARKKSSDSKRYIRDSSKMSCNYPFTSTSFVTTADKPTKIDFSLRTSDDPYIALQRITRGTNNFGMSKGEKLRMGFACIGVGILLIACIAVFIFVLYKLIKKATGKNEAPQVEHYPQQQQQYPQQQYPQEQQYPQPYMQYPQQQQQQYPQQPYPQQQYPQQQYPQAFPATTYGYDGQPQTGYGSPPPPQVQPGYGYGYK